MKATITGLRIIEHPEMAERERYDVLFITDGGPFVRDTGVHDTSPVGGKSYGLTFAKARQYRDAATRMIGGQMEMDGEEWLTAFSDIGERVR